jgi:hypothetical protein rflaF_05709
MKNTNLAIKPEQEAVIINERIRANGQAAVTAVCAVGRDLRRMKIEELYKYLGYTSFEEYTEQEYGMKRRQAYQYISVYENLGEDFVQSNAQLGITKLSLLTQINKEERAEIMEDNDLSGMTVSEVKGLLDKVKQQGEQLSLFENEKENNEKQLEDIRTQEEKIRSLQARLDDTGNAMRKTAAEKQEIEKRNAELEAYIKELESRPVEVAVPEPKEIVKEIIKEVPDKKEIEKKDREIVTLKNKYKALDEARIEEVENLKKSYEARIEQLRKPPEQPADSEKSSFKLLYAEAYKSCLGLVEFIKSSEDKDRGLFTEKTDKLLDLVRESIHGGSNDED